MYSLKTYSLLLFGVFINLSHAYYDIFNDKPIRVLSLDGGGMRGIIQALALASIEEATKEPISKTFDLIAGTSVGGLIALALTTPDENNEPKYSAKDILKVFLERKDEIFYRSLGHKILTLGGLVGPKYESESFKDLLYEYFGDVKLSQALTNVMITGYYVDGQSGIEFASDEAKLFPKDRDCLMRQVAFATSAAPVFFDPATISFEWGALKNVIDGGLFAINPSLHAYVRAKKLFPGRRIEVYSIGTGEMTLEDVENEISGRGLLAWGPSIINHFQIGNSASDNDILYKLLNEDGHQDFFRINVELEKEHKHMDDTSISNVDYLIAQGLSTIRSTLFSKMLSRLTD